MPFTEEIKSVITKFQKSNATFKDGFYHLYNLATSPDTMIEGFSKMPFIKHDRDKRVMSYQSPFMSGQFYYLELEQGLWLMAQEFWFKQNVVIHNVFDKALPPEFNIINLHCSKKEMGSKSMLINGLVLSDKTWSFFKPAKIKDHYHFKGSQEFNTTLFFTDEWLNHYIESTTDLKATNLCKFFHSDNSYIFLEDPDKTIDHLHEQLISNLKCNIKNSRKEQIHCMVNNLFTHFTTLCNKETMTESYFRLSDKDRKYIQKAAGFLQSNLLNDFPGIDVIAQKIGISPTKLKNDFKVIHNKGLFQYFRFHQMVLAKKLLLEKASTVKEVADIMGYKNGSKFSAAFRNQFGMLPSSILNNAN